MKTLLTLILCTTFYVTGWAMSAQAPAAQQPATTTPGVEPAKLSDTLHAKIRDVQYKQSTMQGQYVQLNKQMQDLQKNFLDSVRDLNTLTDMAYRESNIDRTVWELNMETLVFTKKAPPAAPVPAAKPKGAANPTINHSLDAEANVVDVRCGHDAIADIWKKGKLVQVIPATSGAVERTGGCIPAVDTAGCVPLSH